MRYIDSLNIKSNIDVFILIEPGLGYIIPVLQERYKTSKIIVFHVESESCKPVIDQISCPDGNHLQLSHPEIQTLYNVKTLENTEIQKFLEAHIQETDISNIRIIEWRPSLNYYKEAYVRLLSLVVEFIKRTDAVNRTTAAFGKRWVKNFFKNLGMINKTLFYKQSAIPVIITGSGPSLEHALPVIKKAQKNSLIIAASSSVMTLTAADIKADLVIATDGGSWALKHFYPCYRNTSPGALAVNLCAALPSQAAHTPKLLINDGSFWQTIVLHELELPSVIIPQRGTVTATAVELAILLTKGNIYLAGIDSSVIDIRTHARPYSFDSLFLNNANRFMPYYSECFTRSALINKGGSMSIYAAWFKNQLESWPKRIYSIGNNNIFLNGSGLLDLNLSKAQDNSDKKNNSFKIADTRNNPLQFYKKGVSALLNAVKNNEYSQNIKKELIPLLFPGLNTSRGIKDENKISERELETAIKEVAFSKVSYE